MATAEAKNSSLLDLVHCNLCLEKYNDSNRLPKLLNCSHTFCLACVEKYYKSKLKTKLSCPNCRKEFAVPQGGVQDLNTNIVVVNLLDHLAPVTTDDGVAEANAVPKETQQKICGVHPGEKCDFYCDDCADPLCADCMLTVNKGPHKSHTIRKFVEVLDTFNTQRKDTADVVVEMKREGEKRTQELLEELVLSRDSLMKEAKSKRDKAHKEADRWYQSITTTISQVYDKLRDQILQFSSKVDLQELRLSLEKIDLQQKLDGNLKEAQRCLGELQKSLTSWKESNDWPTKYWSADVGNITDGFTIDLGSITEPTLKLPDVNRFPYAIETTDMRKELNQPTGSRQKLKQAGFRLLSDLLMRPCACNVGLTTSEAVFSFELERFIRTVTFKGNKVIELHKTLLPRRLEYHCRKYIFTNKYVLVRDFFTGPSHILNPQLELIATIQENYGHIIGAENTQWVAFDKGGDDSIRIYDMERNRLLQTITLPASATWLGSRSVCRHPASQFTAVADTYGRQKLYIFDRRGRHLHTHNFWFHSNMLMCPIIACNRRHLYVASDDPVGVFVLSWSGQLVTTLDSQQLRMKRGEEVLLIAVSEDQFSIAVMNCDKKGNGFKTFQCV